ncbi:MAG: 16S rRNA (cytosine(1402)-N(4))-methyltransferase RsmH, partial [Malacoplasma sp.]|nr:16S rRNA (cytosine(1402)-N(4))-methyltransferase RsmH [Malacoplasma sp.]
MLNKNNNFNHISVRLEDAVDCLNIKENNVYVDCTFGRGGHSLEILKKLNNTGKLIVFDLDKEAKDYYETNFINKKNCFFINKNFRYLKEELEKLSVFKVDGFLFDFGVSSPMFDNPERGFSYKKDAKLDMRMDQSQKLSAFDVINFFEKEKLIKIFKKYGEISNPSFVVNEIVNERKNKPIHSTLELVEIIKRKTPKKMLNLKKHFARTYFQAIRIEVNDELNSIKQALSDALMMLNKKGRIVTITFHSLEEREVKNVYKKVLVPQFPKEIPINNKSNFKIVKIKSRKALQPELEKN